MPQFSPVSEAAMPGSPPAGDIGRVTPPTIAVGRFFRVRPTIVIMICTFAPIVALSVLSWCYADILHKVVPIELSNFEAVRIMCAGLLHPSVRPDSWGPMLQALNVLHGPEREPLYETLFFAGHVRFQYPPTSLLAVDLLSGVGLASIRTLNAINSLVYVANAAAVGGFVWLLFHAPSRLSRAPHRGGMTAIAIAAACVFYPIVRADVLGQVQLWIDFLFTSALVAWVLDRRLFAGVLLGLACTIKPQLALLLLWGLLWREWTFSAGILTAALPVTIVSVSLYGLHAHLAYLDVLAFLSRHGESFFANNSVNGILNFYLSPTDSLHWDSQNFTPFHPIVYLGTVVASILALAAIALPPLLQRKRRPDITDLGAAAICTVIGSPVAWEHHYGILLPLFAVALRLQLGRPEGTGGGARLACLALAWVLVADFIPFANLLAGTPFSVAQAHLFFGALLLLVLLAAPTRG